MGVIPIFNKFQPTQRDLNVSTCPSFESANQKFFRHEVALCVFYDQKNFRKLGRSTTTVLHVEKDPTYYFVKTYLPSYQYQYNSVCDSVWNEKNWKQCWKKVCTTKYFHFWFSMISNLPFKIIDRIIHKGTGRWILVKMNVTGWYKKQVKNADFFPREVNFLLYNDEWFSNTSSFSFIF